MSGTSGTSATTGVVLGYGGGASIEITDTGSGTSGTSGKSWLFMTGGSLTVGQSLPMFQPYGMPNTSDSRGQVILAKGFKTFSGNINFDVTNKAVSLLTSLAKRNQEFEVMIHDGNVGYKLPKSKMEGFTVSASPQSLVTGTINFQSTNNLEEDLTKYTDSIEYVFKPDEADYQLVKYWHTGGTDVESFTFNFSQTLTPIFLNCGKDTPRYIRAGALQVSLSVVAWSDWLAIKKVKMGDVTIEIVTGNKESMDFTYGGPTETGLHTYNFKGYSEDDSSTEFFKIT